MLISKDDLAFENKVSEIVNRVIRICRFVEILPSIIHLISKKLLGDVSKSTVKDFVYQEGKMELLNKCLMETFMNSKKLDTHMFGHFFNQNEIKEIQKLGEVLNTGLYDSDLKHIRNLKFNYFVDLYTFFATADLRHFVMRL